MTLHFYWTYLETQKGPNDWYKQTFFVWCLLRQRNGGSNSGLKPATIVTDPNSNLGVVSPCKEGDPYENNAFLSRTCLWLPLPEWVKLFPVMFHINETYLNLPFYWYQYWYVCASDKKCRWCYIPVDFTSPFCTRLKKNYWS